MGNRYRSSHVRKNRGLTKKQPEEGELILKPIVKEALLKQFCTIADLMYQKGWDERNGGNISMLLKEEDLLNIEQAVGTRDYDPVSYTHLDVYKRQSFTFADLERMARAEEGESCYIRCV